MKKKFAFPLVHQAYKTFYNVLNNYSLDKLRKLIKLDGFRHIFIHFFESGLMEQMIQTDPTMSPNQETYRDGLRSIMKMSKELTPNYKNDNS